MTIKQIAIGALAGWSAIVGLAWWFANQRASLCGAWYEHNSCQLAAIARRDNVLIGGLTVALVAAIGAALVVWIRSERLNRPGQAPRAAKQAESSRLLP